MPMTWDITTLHNVRVRPKPGTVSAVNGEVDIAMNLHEVYEKLAHEFRMLRNVVEVSLAEPVPFDFRIRVELSDWDWDTWQLVHDRVDDMAREHVLTASVTAEVTLAEDAAYTVTV